MRNSSKYICPTSPTCSKTVSRRKGFTLLELIVVVVTIGILALMAIASFSGVINNTSASTVDATAASIARDAKVISAFNPGSLTNVVSDANVDVAVAEAALDASAGWAVDTSSTEGASISLTKNGKTCSTTITVAAGTVSASDASCGAAAGGGAGGGFTLSYTSPIVSFLQSQTSQTVSPIVSNGTAASFSYTGSLPAGVSFDTTTGELTGPSAWNFTVAKLAVGTSHTCALTTTGAVKCWGYNFGYPNLTSPTDVTGLSSGVATIDAGRHFTCVVTTAGAVKCWGSNNSGQLGDGTTNFSPTPVDVTGLASGVASVTADGQTVCALTTSGGVKCWGYNGQGQFGDGTTTNSSVPVNITGLASGVASIDMGNEQACALTTSGGVKCWGGTYGLTPVNVSGLTSGVASISVGAGHSCAVTTSGGAKCWGSNSYGEVGDGTTTTRPTPVDVSGLTSGVASIDAGKYGTCAVTTSGGAKCWGYNGNGEVGDGTTTTRLTPVDVSGLTSGVVSVNTTSGNAGNHVCAITTGGGAKCWGWNGDGQLGTGSTTSSSTPVNVVNVGPLTGWPTSITVNVTSTSGAVTSTVITLTAS